MEILAPSGNINALKAAVACGADAVYLGVKNFNARSKAENFSDEELRFAISYCHERGVRVYVTFNTLVKDGEMGEALESVRTAAEAGADAFLIQDLGLYLALDKELPDAVYHASTQMGVHNVYGALFVQKLGFDRVVLSREVLAEDIAKIKTTTNLEIELFAHGAHCVSFSGNCYFSALVSGYSGNRGKCMQLCRKKYTLTGGKKSINGYMLSAKDICMIGNTDKLRRLGVDSLKIEGRLRSTEYAGVTSDAYKRALSDNSGQEDMRRLKTVFNRGDFSQAYLNDDRAEIIYDKQQNNIGLKVAEVAAIRGKTLLCKGGYKPKVGDGYKIIRGGRECGSAYVSNGSLVFSGSPRIGDDLNITKSRELTEEITRRIKSDIRHSNRDFAKITRKNHSIMSDIVHFKYDLPSSCKIVCANETCRLSEIRDMADIIVLSPTEYSVPIVKAFTAECKKPVLLDMPIEARGKDVSILEEIVKSNLVSGYVANNVYALEMCRDYPILLGTGMNVLSSMNCPKIMSVEAADTDGDAAIYAFGRATLMNLTHCPRKQLGFDCSNCGKCGQMTLTDERGNKFILRRHRLHYCYYELLNSKIHYLLPKLNTKRHKRIYFDLRDIDEGYALRALSGELAFDERINTYGRLGKGVK